MYIEPAELRTILIDCKRQGTITAELVPLLRVLVEKISGRYHFPSSQRGDVLSEVIISLITFLPKIDPERNLFAYLTTIIKNQFFHFQRDKHTMYLPNNCFARMSGSQRNPSGTLCPEYRTNNTPAGFNPTERTDFKPRKKRNKA